MQMELMISQLILLVKHLPACSWEMDSGITTDFWGYFGSGVQRSILLPLPIKLMIW